MRTMIVAVLVILSGSALGAQAPVVSSASGMQDAMCDACFVVGRAISDYLCDFEFLVFAVEGVQNSICTQLENEDERGQCMQLVDILLPMAVGYARTEVPPAAMCSYAGLCGNTGAGAVRPGPSHKAAQLLRRMYDSPAQCAQCQYLVSSVKASGAASPQAVLNSARQACVALPKDLVGSCNELVEQSSAVLPRFISLNRPCEVMGPCTWSLLDSIFGAEQRQLGAMSGSLAQQRQFMAAASAQLSQAMKRAVASNQRADAAVALGDATPCDKCKMTVLEVRVVVNNPTVQASIVNVTRAICDKLAPYEQQCRDMVDKYSPAAFSLVDKYLQPDIVCGTVLRLCTAKAAEPSRQVNAAVLAPAKMTSSSWWPWPTPAAFARLQLRLSWWQRRSST